MKQSAGKYMCVNQEMEKLYDNPPAIFCFDNLIQDLGCGWDKTIAGYLLEWGILVTDEGKFGRNFLDFLENMHDQSLITPVKD
jgi:hypothetical protein